MESKGLRRLSEASGGLQEVRGVRSGALSGVKGGARVVGEEVRCGDGDGPPPGGELEELNTGVIKELYYYLLCY